MNGTDLAVQAIKGFYQNDKLDIEWLTNEIQLLLDNEEYLTKGMLNTRRPAHSPAYEALVKAINSKSNQELSSRQVQAGFKALGLDFKEILKPAVEYVNERRQESAEELEESKLVESKFGEKETYNAGDIVDVKNAYGEIINGDNPNFKIEIVRQATKEESENLWNSDITCYITKTIAKSEDVKFLEGESVTPITRLRLHESKVEEDAKPVKGVLGHIMNIYSLISSALDIAEKQNDEVCNEIAGYLYTAIDNISDLDAQGGLGLRLEVRQRKLDEKLYEFPTEKEKDEFIEENNLEKNKDYKDKGINAIDTLNEEKEIKNELYDPMEGKGTDLAGDIVDFMRNFDTYEFNNNYDSYDDAIEDVLKDLVYSHGRQDMITYLNSLIENQEDEDADEIKSLIARIEDLDNEMKKFDEDSEKVKEDKSSDEFLTDREEEIFNDLKNQEEETTLLDSLQERIGQKMSVGEFNTSMQSLFAQYDTIWLRRSELYDKNIDESQEIVIFDDEDMYVITYNIIDLDDSIIEITDVNME